MDTKTLRKNLVGGSVGNVLEWYDFAVFGYFASVIGAQFFPSEDATAQLIQAFGVFAAGYLVRPIGGAIFGKIGDTQGRRKALQMSIVLMMIPTVLVGLLPVHKDVGVLAPILLVVMRLFQGVSVGGELIGSISFLTEVAPPNKRSLYGSFSLFSAIGGILLGSLVATILNAVMTTEAIHIWGWRLPFLFGLVIGGYALWSRKHMVESPEFEKAQAAQKIQKSPVANALRHVRSNIVHCAALVSVLGGGFYMLFVWWPTYVSKLIDNPVQDALTSNTISMIVLLVLVPLAGRLADLIGSKKVIMCGTALIACAAYPLFMWVDGGTFTACLVSQLIFAVGMACIQGPMPVAMVGLFPTEYRYSGIAIGYNITLAVLGGTAPLVSTWMVHQLHSAVAPAYYLIVLCLFSFVAAARLKSTSQPVA